MFLFKYIFVFYLFIFNFTIGPLGITSATLVGFFIIIAAAKDRCCLKAIVSYLINSKYLHLSCLFLGVYGFFLSGLWGVYEDIFALIFVKLIISSLIAFAIIYFFAKDLQCLAPIAEREVVYRFFDIFLAVCFLQAFTVILSFLYPEIRDVFNEIIANRGNIDIDHPFRFRGLHDSGGFNLSVVLGIASFYGIYSSVVLGRRGFTLRVFSSLIILFALTLVGRTGLLISIFGLALLFLFRARNFFQLKFTFSVVGFLFITFAFNVVFLDQFYLFNTIIFDYAFEFFLNYAKGDGLSTESSVDLMTMLFVPDLKHLFFGSGSFDEISLGVARSDSGYMKILLASGLLGFVIFYFLLFVLIFLLAKRISLMGMDRLLFVFILSVFLVSEIKGPVFIQNDTSRFILLLAMIIFTRKNICFRSADDGRT